VVVAERIVYWRARMDNATEAAIRGAVEMARPVTAAALTTILSFLPLMAIGGLPGKISWQIPAVVVMVLTFSLVESLCVLPAHMTSQRATAPANKREFVFRFERHYERALRTVLHHRGLVVLIAMVSLAVVMGVVRPLIPFVLFPQEDARILFVKVTAPIGTSLEQTEAYVGSLEQQFALLGGDEISAVTARVGHKDLNGADKRRGDSESAGLISIIFRDTDRRNTNAEWIQLYQKHVRVPADVELLYQSERIGPPADQPVTVHVLANESELRRGVASEIARYLEAIPGVTEIEVDERPGTPQVDLNLNYEKLALLGLDARDVAQTLQAAFFGIEASEHRDMEDTTELRVQFDPAARQDLQSLLETGVRSKTGQLVPLRDVVNPVEIPAVGRIFHREGFRSSTVRASFVPGSGHSALSFADRLDNELLPRYQGVEGLEVLIAGEAEQTRETTADLAQVLTIVVLGIGVVIWIMLGSLVEALFVLLVIPFAIAGVFLAFFLHGMSISMMAMMGAIGLSGVVVNASIVMVDSIHRDARGTGADLSADPVLSSDPVLSTDELYERLVKSVVERLRPILVTSSTTLGGVLPMAYGLGGYDFLVAPMSVALGWGLAISTLVTLFLVPALYSLAQDFKKTPWLLLRNQRVPG
jgi:multidrug efflux pump subunit AcrB